MYKLLLALACVTANQEDAKPSRGLRGLRFASFVNTDKGGPEASKCLEEGGDCKSCCGGCNFKDIDDGTDFRGEEECVCFEAAFDEGESVHLSNHDDCATVVRQGDVRVSIKGEDGTDAIHMASLGASTDSFSPGYIYVYGENYYNDIADGGNFLSCSGDGNLMRGGLDGDEIKCVGNQCDVDGRAGNDDIAVVNPLGPGPGGTDVYTSLLNGGDGIDTCTYNGVQVNDYSVIVGDIQPGVEGCEGGP